jgi:transposase-like protein
MKCPKCGDLLDLTERYWDYDDSETLIGVENYFCKNCFETWSREVTYSLEKASDLEQ